MESSRPSLKHEIGIWKEIGRCLDSGELVLSPFEQPYEEAKNIDVDQIEDNENFRPNDSFTPLEELPNFKKDISQITYTSKIKYFLDGSLRTKYIGEFVENSLSFPIIVSEVSVAVVTIKETKLLPHHIRKKIYFIFPNKKTGLVPDTVYEKLENLQSSFISKSTITQIEFMKKEEIKGDLRSSICAKARGLMHELEQKAANELVKKPDEWLVMDGAIRSPEFKNLTNTIGLAKSFSRKPSFNISNKNHSLTSYLKRIKVGERTAVFSSYKDGPLFWYLRLRSFPPMEPLDGIVKIDLPLSQNKTDIIDSISSEIFALRHPSVYPWPRWPSYIYPIRVTEMYMNANLLGQYALSQIGLQLKSSIRGK